MKGDIEKKGNYELFETNHGHKILNLNNKNYFAIIEGQKGKILVKSDADHKKKKTLQSGEFYLADFEGDPDFKDMPHLFLKEGDQFKEYILPNDLSTNNDKEKKIIPEDKKLSKKKVLSHIKGNSKPDSGKKSGNKKKNLDDLSKKELYEKAKEKNISGRSKMNKEQLEKALQKQ